jgi:hypothetical protein
MLQNELLCLAQVYPGRILSAGVLMFSSIPAAFDTLERNFGRRLILDPSQEARENPISRYRTQTSNICVFTLLGLASGIDCLAEQTGPHPWGDISIPTTLLTSVWPSSAPQGRSQIIVPGVRIIGTQVRGYPFHAVSSCTMLRQLSDFDSLSHVLHKYDAGTMLHTFLKINQIPPLGDRGAWLKTCSTVYPDKILNLTLFSDCLVDVAIQRDDTYLNPANGRTM